MWQHLHYTGSTNPYGCWELVSLVHGVWFISSTLSRGGRKPHGQWQSPLILAFFPSKSGPPVIFFMTRQRMPQTLLGTKRQMLCMTAGTWIIQRKHLDLVLFIKKCHDVQLEAFRDYFKVHSSRNIRTRLWSAKGNCHLVIIVLLPSIWLWHLACVFPCIKVLLNIWRGWFRTVWWWEVIKRWV